MLKSQTSDVAELNFRCIAPSACHGFLSGGWNSAPADALGEEFAGLIVAKAK